ncbi:MAG: M20/M25/M40 family metallo-hydrolase [Blautia marasmi]
MMHACGHDVHMAVLLGCIRILQACRDSIRGNVVFLFQPSEEQQGGAKRMVEEGVMDDPKPELTAAFHVWPQRAGSITCMSGPVMAQPDAFGIEIKGMGGHGASPSSLRKSYSCYGCAGKCHRKYYSRCCIGPGGCGSKSLPDTVRREV